VTGNSITLLGDTGVVGSSGPADPGGTPDEPGTEPDAPAPGDDPADGPVRPALAGAAAALAVTGQDAASPLLGLAAAGLGLVLVGARRLLSRLRG